MKIKMNAWFFKCFQNTEMVVLLWLRQLIRGFGVFFLYYYIFVEFYIFLYFNRISVITFFLVLKLSLSVANENPFKFNPVSFPQGPIINDSMLTFWHNKLSTVYPVHLMPRTLSFSFLQEFFVSFWVFRDHSPRAQGCSCHCFEAISIERYRKCSLFSRDKKQIMSLY